MLENSREKILLLSSDPHDASFLAEIAIAQQAGLEIASDESDLCSKIAEMRNSNSLLAVFVDVTGSDSLRRFEFALQSKMGVALATELSSIIHFISGTPLSMNREILQSPYFSFYLERKPFAFRESAEFYENAFLRISEIKPNQWWSFDQKSILASFEPLKKFLIEKGVSPEWIMKFTGVYHDRVEDLFPSRFDLGIDFDHRTIRIMLKAPNVLQKEKFRVDAFLGMGVSVSWFKDSVVLFVPVFVKSEQAKEAFRFVKWEK